MAELLEAFSEALVIFGFDWTLLHCNAAAETHFRFRRADVLGKVIWDLVPGRGGRIHGFLHAAMESRQPAETELPSDVHPGHSIAMRVFPLEVGVGVGFRDLTARYQREQRERDQAARLAELEQRRAFLLTLSDRLRDTEDPGEILATASRMLAERLGLLRAGYAEINPDARIFVIRGDWNSEGAASVAGHEQSLDAFGPTALEVLSSGQPLVANDVRTDPRTAAFADAYRRIGVGATLDMPLIRGGRFDSFFFANAREPREWTEEDVALVGDVAARTWSSLTRARVERALRESEARFRTMADSAPAPVWLTNAAGNVEFLNRALGELLGRTTEELLGDAWAQHMHPEDLIRMNASRTQARSSGYAPYSWMARFRRHDGEWRWMHGTSQPRFDEAGVFQGYISLAMDVTEARRAERRQQMLINELNHRVKNTLATVQSLAHQTLRQDSSRQQLNERLFALSAAHNVLTRRNWESGGIVEIASEAVRPYDDHERSRFTLSGPEVSLPPSVSLAVSMALHELATNAVKYGALSGPGGRVGVTWNWRDGAIDLEWRETGGPPVTPPTRRGFGSRLLGAGLTAELGSPADIAYAPEGVICRIHIPMRAAVTPVGLSDIGDPL
ncbi:MAG: HWE histidine kinase domain-containing protein [Pseudomonadota bacterium]